MSVIDNKFKDYKLKSMEKSVLKLNIIAVVGSYSDIGKGNFVSSLVYLLNKLSINAVPIKFDGYLNYNSGSMNPYHTLMKSVYSEEEVFVLKDGFEGDADSGYYERFTGKEYTKNSNLTNGIIFRNLIEYENKNHIKGEVLKFLHIRKEVENWLKINSKENNIIVVEIGGTINDDENLIMFQTLSELKETGKAKVFTIMLSPYWINSDKKFNLELSSRSKITRMGFDSAWRLGLRPNMIVLRTDLYSTVLDIDRAYINKDTKVPQSNILIDPDVDFIYKLPEILKNQDIIEIILQFFKIHQCSKSNTFRLENYSKKISVFKKRASRIRVGIYGKTPSYDSYISLVEAVEHSSVANNIFPEIVWLEEIKNIKKEKIDCLIVGEGLHDIDRKLEILNWAKKNYIPTLAIGFGADLMILEQLMSCGVSISHPELNNKNQTIFSLFNKLILGERNINLLNSSQFLTKDGKERFRTLTKITDCGVTDIVKNGLSILASNDEVGPVAWSLPQHPMYLGVKFKPEFKSYPGIPHPLLKHLILIAINKNKLKN